jgi:hypothetical protein
MATFAEEMLADIESKIRKLNGLRSANIDGTMLNLDDLMAVREKWKAEIAQEQGERPRCVRVNLSGGPE